MQLILVTLTSAKDGSNLASCSSTSGLWAGGYGDGLKKRNRICNYLHLQEMQQDFGDLILMIGKWDRSLKRDSWCIWSGSPSGSPKLIL